MKPPCCKKCHSQFIIDTVEKPLHGVRCSNPSCECHISKGLREEFDEKFPADNDAYIKSGTSYAIKSFISNLLSERDEEIVRMLEGMNRKYLHSVIAKGSQEDLNDMWREGFNKALQQAIEKIKGMRHDKS